MRTIKLTLEYLGTHYCGWERQPGGVSIRGTLEDLLSKITGEPVSLTVAGRTDAGVHAAANAASFVTSSKKSLSRIAWSANSMLPRDISVMSAEEAPEGFDARRDALWRRYEYLVLNRPQRSALLGERSLHVARPLDETAMRAALKSLLGKHDFAGFSTRSGTRDRSTVCSVLEATCESRGVLVAINLRADGFLHNMVRIIAGTVIRVGLGELGPAQTRTVLETRDRRNAAQTAPACGLTMVAVGYPEQEG